MISSPDTCAKIMKAYPFSLKDVSSSLKIIDEWVKEQTEIIAVHIAVDKNFGMVLFGLGTKSGTFDWNFSDEMGNLETQLAPKMHICYIPNGNNPSDLMEGLPILISIPVIRNSSVDYTFTDEE